MGSLGDTPSIPTIDLSRWHQATDDNERLVVANELINACRSVGFAYIINHGIPQDTIDNAFAQSARLFNMSVEDKAKAPHPDGFVVHRGYSYIGRERSSVYTATTEEEAKAAEKIADVRESYELGSNDNEREPNVYYPEEVFPGFTEWGLDFYWTCNQVARCLLQAVALGIGLDRDYLLQYHSGHNNQLRLAHYPAVPAAKLETNEATRLAPHTDFTTITMLFQDDIGGLEVKNPYKEGSEFMEATPVKGAIVFNVGDFLMRWSNDTFLSNHHRVQPPPLADRFEGPERITKARFSIPYFVFPNHDISIETFPACIDAEHPRKYNTVSVEDYRNEKYSKIIVAPKT